MIASVLIQLVDEAVLDEVAVDQGRLRLGNDVLWVECVSATHSDAPAR